MTAWTQCAMLFTAIDGVIRRSGIVKNIDILRYLGEWEDHDSEFWKYSVSTAVSSDSQRSMIYVTIRKRGKVILNYHIGRIDPNKGSVGFGGKCDIRDISLPSNATLRVIYDLMVVYRNGRERRRRKKDAIEENLRVKRGRKISSFLHADNLGNESTFQ